METIRICEESEARLMIREGTFIDYVMMWSEKFPQKKTDATSKLCLIRDLKLDLGCKLLEAKLVVDSLGSNYTLLAESVIFEIGDRVRIEKAGGVHYLFTKVNGEWRKGKMTWLESEDHDSYLFLIPGINVKAKRRPQRIKFGEF